MGQSLTAQVGTGTQGDCAKGPPNQQRRSHLLIFLRDTEALNNNKPETNQRQGVVPHAMDSYTRLGTCTCQRPPSPMCPTQDFSPHPQV